MGADESLIDLITETASEEGLNIDLTDAEIAVAVLPTALALGESVTNDIFELGNWRTVRASEIGAGASAEPGGVVVVVRPTNIAALESATRESEGVPTSTEQYLGSDVLTYASNDTFMRSTATS